MTTPIGSNHTLRPYAEADRRAFIVINSDPNVVRYVGDGDVDPAREDALFDRILELDTGPEQQFAFVLAVVRDDEVVGHVELKTTDECASGEWEFVYLLAESEWGQGVGTALATWARDTAHAHGKHLLATVHPENVTSLHILRRLGLTVERNLEDGTVVMQETY